MSSEIKKAEFPNERKKTRVEELSEVLQATGLKAERECGSGGFGDLWLCKDNLECSVILKVIRTDENPDWNNEARGIQLYCDNRRCLDNQHLIQIYAANRIKSFFYYTMEYADRIPGNPDYCGETLFSKIEREGVLDAEMVRQYGLELIDGVQCLHDHHLVHRDLKPANLLFVNGKLKITDFSLLTKAVEGQVSMGKGTPGYMVQEAFDYLEPSQTMNGYMSDCYAVGMVIYYMLTGGSPSLFPDFSDMRDNSRVYRHLNRFLHKACSHNKNERYKSIAAFRADFEKCYKRPWLLNPRILVQVTVGGVLLVLSVMLGVHLAQVPVENPPKVHQPQENGQGGDSVEMVQPQGEDGKIAWVAVTGRAKLLRQFLFRDGIPDGLSYAQIGPSSIAGDGEFFRWTKGGKDGDESSLELYFKEKLPSRFEIVWVCAGTNPDVTMVMSLASSDMGPLALSAELKNGSVYIRQALGKPWDEVRKELERESSCGFIGQHRLIYEGGTLQYQADDVPLYSESLTEEQQQSMEGRNFKLAFVSRRNGNVNLHGVQIYELQ